MRARFRFETELLQTHQYGRTRFVECRNLKTHHLTCTESAPLGIKSPKASKLSKLNPFSKKLKDQEEKTPLVSNTEEQALAEQKQKELIMKHRNMNEEEVEKYLEEKKNGDNMNAERGLRAFGWALAPVRL